MGIRVSDLPGGGEKTEGATRHHSALARSVKGCY